MAVYFKTGFVLYTIGPVSLLNSLFSTIRYHLEPNGWGTRYPIMMNQGYQGKVEHALIPDLIKEVKSIQQELKALRPDQVVWDIEDLTAKPPWGDEVIARITDLSNYHIATGGQTVLDLLIEVLEAAMKVKFDFEIATYQGLS
ncbi:MAG: hypothetical protein J7559_12345 [Cohnella sp.]|nr:hypothetical protein [Cohnella sp.]